MRISLHQGHPRGRSRWFFFLLQLLQHGNIQSNGQPISIDEWKATQGNLSGHMQSVRDQRLEKLMIPWVWRNSTFRVTREEMVKLKVRQFQTHYHKLTYIHKLMCSTTLQRGHAEAEYRILFVDYKESSLCLHPCCPLKLNINPKC